MFILNAKYHREVQTASCGHSSVVECWSPKPMVGGSNPSVRANSLDMDINISKSDYKSILSLIDKAVAIIKSNPSSTREYNVARQLGNIRKKLERNNPQQ